MARDSSRVRLEPTPGWRSLAGGVYVRRMVEGNGCSINLYQISAGHRFDLHHHPYAELGVLIAGQGVLLVEDEERSMRDGDSFYVPGDVPHGFVVPEGRPVVLMDVTVPQYADGSGPTTDEVLRQAGEVLRRVGEEAPARPRGDAGRLRRGATPGRPSAPAPP